MQATLNPVELLRQYLRSTPAHELAADWAAVDALGIEGPTLSEVLSFSTQYSVSIRSAIRSTHRRFTLNNPSRSSSPKREEFCF